MGSIPHTTHGVNGPCTTVSQLSESSCPAPWLDADLRAMQRNGHYRVAEEWIAGAWLVLNPVDGWEFASAADCSCYGVFGRQDQPACEHIRAVQRYLAEMAPPPDDDHEGWATMGGPI